MEQLKNFRLSNLLALTAAGIINAIGVTIFLSPVKLYDSGISGTSMLLAQVTPEWLTLSVFLLVLNVPLFLYGLKKQWPLFTLYAIYTVCIYSLAAWLITDVLPVDVSFASPLAGQDLLLCALFGGLISGVGSGMAIRFGGAMDGIEVMASLQAKSRSFSPLPKCACIPSRMERTPRSRSSSAASLARESLMRSDRFSDDMSPKSPHQPHSQRLPRTITGLPQCGHRIVDMSTSHTTNQI